MVRDGHRVRAYMYSLSNSQIIRQLRRGHYARLARSRDRKSNPNRSREVTKSTTSLPLPYMAHVIVVLLEGEVVTTLLRRDPTGYIHEAVCHLCNPPACRSNDGSTSTLGSSRTPTAAPGVENRVFPHSLEYENNSDNTASVSCPLLQL